MPESSPYQRIYAVVRRIPRGKVATYGQVARLARLPGRARQVGYAMHALPQGTTVPWQRVVNAQGRVSRRRIPGAELTQRMLLLREGVRFGGGGCISLALYGWKSTVIARERSDRSNPAIASVAALPRND